MGCITSFIVTVQIEVILSFLVEVQFALASHFQVLWSTMCFGEVDREPVLENPFH